MPDQDKSRYLDYLPAIFDDQAHGYLGQFLLPFEQVYTDVEDLLSVIDRYFAPALTAEGFLPWFAQWVALVLDETWDVTKQRRFIADALELYRRRGTVEGIRQYLQLYDEQYRVRFREGHAAGGMQIGVSSRIGGIGPDNPHLAEIEQVERQTPPAYRDYYVVDTVASPGRAGHPAEAEAGQALRLYYEADEVKDVDAGGGPGKPYVKLTLLGDENEPHVHMPGQVNRLEHVIDDSYRLTLANGPVLYLGDTRLVAEPDEPYHFIVDVQAPAGWQSVFDLALSFADDGLLDAAFRRAFGDQGIDLRDDAIRMIKPGRLWQATHGNRKFSIRRKPLESNIFVVTHDCKTPLFTMSLSFEDFDRKVIDARIRSEFEEHGIVAQSVQLNDALQECEVIGKAQNGDEDTYVIIREGIVFRVYRRVGLRRWTEAMQPDKVRAIKAIIDEVKPAHTLYHLKITPKSDLRPQPPMQIGAGFGSRINVDSIIG
jgi:phage tail-like protein